MKYIDLTHTLSSEIPSWDGDCGFKITIQTDYKDCTAPDLFRTQQIETRGGMGTHMDSPAHCFEGAQTIEKLELEILISDCVVIKTKEQENENLVIMPSEIEAFEKQYGYIKSGTFVIFSTGWDKHWNTPEKYRNDFKFPSVHEDTAKLLLERNITGLGIDTFSCDTGEEGFPVHRVILGSGKYLVENIANAGELPPTGAKIFVMPIKIRGGTEAPIRLIATHN